MGHPTAILFSRNKAAQRAQFLITIILTEFPTKILSTSSAQPPIRFASLSPSLSLFLRNLTENQENPSLCRRHFLFSSLSPPLWSYLYPYHILNKVNLRLRTGFDSRSIVMQFFFAWLFLLFNLCRRSGVSGTGIERHRISVGRLLRLHNRRRRHSRLPTGGDAVRRV